MNNRIQKLIEVFIESNIDAFLVSNMKNIRYLSGFTGDTAKLVIAGGKGYLIVDLQGSAELSGVYLDAGAHC